MILSRYIVREILKPTALICAVLAFIFGCYIATRYLEDAVHGQLPATVVITLILLRVAIAMEVLLPTTLYLSVVITFGRLYRDSEMAAFCACGISPARILRSVFVASLIVASVAACFSLYIRPWAWDRFFHLKARALADFDLTRMKGGIFYEIENGTRVIFAESVDRRTNRARNVFIQTKRDGDLQVLHAEEAEQFGDPRRDERLLVFHRGWLYEFPAREDQTRILRFERSTMELQRSDEIHPKHKVKAVPTRLLEGSRRAEEIAELEWRLTNPLSCILLALLGVPLSRSSPRQSKYTKAPMAIALFAVYFHLGAVVKKWVAQGVLPPVPGVWSVQLVLVVLLLLLLRPPRGSRWTSLS